MLAVLYLKDNKNKLKLKLINTAKTRVPAKKKNLGWINTTKLVKFTETNANSLKRILNSNLISNLNKFETSKKIKDLFMQSLHEDLLIIELLIIETWTIKGLDN